MHVRFDRLAGADRGSWELAGARASGRTDELAGVRPLVCAAEARAAAGDWVVLVLAYEAAPAFEAAMRVAGDPPPGTPLAWWASFAERRAVDGLKRGGGAGIVTATERAGNALPFPLGVADIRDRIARGDVYQVNLTERFAGAFTGSPLDLYGALLSAQRSEFACYVEIDDRCAIASTSPELCFAWDGDTITCRPMKGTTARHVRPALDDEAAERLRTSDKERAENVMIVDLVRNDLSRIARLGTVRVPKLFTVERYETVWQLTSTVEAECRPGTALVDVLGALFPCGSVTGAPKLAAMKVIAQMESWPRGFYCGAIGLLAPPGHGPRAVFSVPIRTAVVDPATSTFVYGSGGGITWSSDPDAEERELQAKARVLTAPRPEFELLDTLRLDAGGVRHVAEHVARLSASAAWFGFPLDGAALSARLHALGPSSEQPERVRVLVARDGSVRIERHPFAETAAPVGLAVDDRVTRADDPFCCHKTTFRVHYDAARDRHPAAEDVVLVNELGHAVETTIANLAYRMGTQWFTPPLSDGGLDGVARGLALRDGRLRERSIAARDLETCDELAVLNDLRGWRRARLVASGYRYAAGR